MLTGGEGALTVTVRMKVSPEPESQQALLDLMRRYRDALNYSVRTLIASRALSLTKAHRLLYSTLRERYGLPARVAQDCYREAIAIARSWLKNPRRGSTPTVKGLSMWLTHGLGYRVKGDHVELAGSYRLRVIGWDRRYDDFPNREARLVFRDGRFDLYVAKRVPRPAKYAPKGVLAVDVNERQIVVGNSSVEQRIETPVERALRYRRLAERLQGKYSSPKYSAWRRRSGVRRRVRHFHRKARNIIEDWARRTAHIIVSLAKQSQLAVAREDLTGLVESLRELPKSHRTALIALGYRRLGFWLDWQAEKGGVPLFVVEPAGTSSTCPRCGTKLVEVGYRRLRCPNCGLEADRDSIAVLNIEGRALGKMGGSLASPTAPQMTTA
ncbi:RNA-guided endonuclease TnpB family protein [Acidilobus sp. 7A]|uniref:RNA-guided endonuclease TnpB family protein n=1 Tax=Acidilobus sp. 7A TaxID=1577685 RepID=UPI001B3B6C40|nr:RNA-guided endonuclease TnpB family protein [Acidilobus sp. 7A]